MISLGEDRRVCEYDLENSSIETGVLCYSPGGEETRRQRRESLSRTSNKNGANNALKSVAPVEKIKIPVIEVVANPTALLWHPRISEEDNEEKFVIVNTDYKFKEFNAHSKQCRKTTLAPMFSNCFDSNFQNNFSSNFSSCRITPHTSSSPSVSASSPPNRLLPIRVNDKVTHYAFSCPSRIIGIGSFPLRGDPSQVNKLLRLCECSECNIINVVSPSL